MKNFENYNVEISKKKKSVRTTFTISQNTIVDINWLSKELKTTAKGVIELTLGFQNIINYAVGQIKRGKFTQGSNLEKKVFAIEEETRSKLNIIAKDNGISRDCFIELALSFLANILREDRKEKTENEKKAREIIWGIVRQAEKAEKEITELLGEDHPACEDFGYGITNMLNSIMLLEGIKED
ncbi:MAG: hypothetical protein WCT23_04275 [Candidatus Neomarinimicrobiota bacterium]|jgi:uncharacterized protein YbaP (TraB family)